MTSTTPTPPAPSGPNWQDWATRTTAILAVLAALSSGRWGASNLQAILEQGKVNDTWAYYQSDSIKEHSAEQATGLAKALSTGQPPSTATALSDLVKQLKIEAEHEAEKKQQQQNEARAYELSRDRMVERGFWYEISFAALQLAVILTTIATGAKRKGPWLAAMGIGVIGMLVLFNGFHPVVHAPRSWYQGVSEQMEAKFAPPPAQPATGP